MRWRSPQHHATGKINVTPLIDVVMCLIIFYLLVGKLALDKQGKVQLPPSIVGVAESERLKGMIINVMPKDGRVVFVINSKEASGQELEDLVRVAAASDVGATGGSKVQVRADRRLRYGDVKPAIEACRKAGLTSVLLTTSKEGA